jgi:hypothetical protein
LSQSGLLQNLFGNQMPNVNTAQLVQGLFNTAGTQAHNELGALAAQYNREGTPAATNTGYLTTAGAVANNLYQNAAFQGAQISATNQQEADAAATALQQAIAGTPSQQNQPSTGGNQPSAPSSPDQGPSSFPGGPSPDQPGAGNANPGGGTTDPNAPVSV